MADRGTVGFSVQPNPRTGVMTLARGMGTYKRKVPKMSMPATDAEPGLGATIEQQVRLYGQSTGVANLAGDPFVVEQAKHAVLSALRDYVNVQEWWRNKWLVLYRLYRGDTLAQPYGRNQLHVPEPFKAVETLHPRLMRSIFGSQRWYRLVGADDTWDANARAQERLTMDQFRAMDYKRKAERMLRDGLIYGTAPQKTYWKQEIVRRKTRRSRRVPDPRFPGATRVVSEVDEREEFLVDGNWTEPVNVFDFFAPPSASTIEEAEWAADRSHWPDWKVKQMGELGHWVNLRALKDSPGTASSTYDDEFKERKSYSYGVYDPRNSTSAPHVPHYCVIDWWGPLVVRVSGGNYETRQCNVVLIEPSGPQVIPRVTENPFWHGQKPYQVWRPITLEDELFGIGALEMIARNSYELDTKRNLLMAATQLEANPVLAVSDEANVPDGQLLIEPGLIIRVPGDPSKAIAPVHVPQVSDAALKAENILKVDIRETTGTTSPYMGASDPFASGKTATQHTSEINQADTRLAGLVERWDLDVTTNLLFQMTWNNQQFMSYERVIREIGPDGIRFRDKFTVRPEDLLGRFIVQPLAGLKLAHKQVQIQQLVSLLDRAPIINQMYGPQAVKIPRLLGYILEQGFDVVNVDDFIDMGSLGLSTLLTAMQEHELWYHGSVPPRREDDNDLRHAYAHMEELKSERFEKLSSQSPETAALARAHVADHLNALALLADQQEKQMMMMAQQQGMAGAAPGVPGAPLPGEDPESPKVRRNENERGEEPSNGASEAKSQAGQEAPNMGSMV